MVGMAKLLYELKVEFVGGTYSGSTTSANNEGDTEGSHSGCDV